MADLQAKLSEALEKQADLAKEICALRTQLSQEGQESGSAVKKQKTSDFRFSTLLKSIKPSGTVVVFSKVKQMQAQGKKVVSLCVGEPDFPPPAETLAATKSAVDEGIYRYTTSMGTPELRQAICADL